MSRLPNIVSVPASFLAQEFPQKAQIQVSRAWLENLGYDVQAAITKERPQVVVSTPIVQATTIVQIPQTKPQAKPQAVAELPVLSEIDQHHADEENELAQMIADEEKEKAEKACIPPSQVVQPSKHTSSGYSTSEEWEKKTQETQETSLTDETPSGIVTPAQEHKVSKRLF